MSPEAIEPSEIITKHKSSSRERVTHINPQIRLLARFVDYGLFFLCLIGLQVLMGRKYPSDLFGHIIPFEFFAWIPFEALFLTLWGRTPGKFFLRTKLIQGRRMKFDMITALRRSFHVWFRGLGMGILGINLFCMLLAANRLKVTGMTSWDREENIRVTHGMLSNARMLIAFVFICISFMAYYLF